MEIYDLTTQPQPPSGPSRASPNFIPALTKLDFVKKIIYLIQQENHSAARFVVTQFCRKHRSEHILFQQRSPSFQEKMVSAARALMGPENQQAFNVFEKMASENNGKGIYWPLLLTKEFREMKWYSKLPLLYAMHARQSMKEMKKDEEVIVVTDKESVETWDETELEYLNAHRWSSEEKNFFLRYVESLSETAFNRLKFRRLEETMWYDGEFQAQGYYTSNGLANFILKLCFNLQYSEDKDNEADSRIRKRKDMAIIREAINHVKRNEKNIGLITIVIKDDPSENYVRRRVRNVFVKEELEEVVEKHCLGVANEMLDVLCEQPNIEATDNPVAQDNSQSAQTSTEGGNKNQTGETGARPTSISIDKIRDDSNKFVETASQPTPPARQDDQRNTAETTNFEQAEISPIVTAADRNEPVADKSNEKGFAHPICIDIPIANEHNIVPKRSSVSPKDGGMMNCSSISNPKSDGKHASKRGRSDGINASKMKDAPHNLSPAKVTSSGEEGPSPNCLHETEGSRNEHGLARVLGTLRNGPCVPSKLNVLRGTDKTFNDHLPTREKLLFQPKTVAQRSLLETHEQHGRHRVPEYTQDDIPLPDDQDTSVINNTRNFRVTREEATQGEKDTTSATLTPSKRVRFQLNSQSATDVRSVVRYAENSSTKNTNTKPDDTQTNRECIQGTVRSEKSHQQVTSGNVTQSVFTTSNDVVPLVNAKSSQLDFGAKSSAAEKWEQLLVDEKYPEKAVEKFLSAEEAYSKNFKVRPSKIQRILEFTVPTAIQSNLSTIAYLSKEFMDKLEERLGRYAANNFEPECLRLPEQVARIARKAYGQKAFTNLESEGFTHIAGVLKSIHGDDSLLHLDDLFSFMTEDLKAFLTGSPKKGFWEEIIDPVKDQSYEGRYHMNRRNMKLHSAYNLRRNKAQLEASIASILQLIVPEDKLSSRISFPSTGCTLVAKTATSDGQTPGTTSVVAQWEGIIPFTSCPPLMSVFMTFTGSQPTAIRVWPGSHKLLNIPKDQQALIAPFLHSKLVTISPYSVFIGRGDLFHSEPSARELRIAFRDAYTATTPLDKPPVPSLFVPCGTGHCNIRGHVAATIGDFMFYCDSLYQMENVLIRTNDPNMPQ